MKIFWFSPYFYPHKGGVEQFSLEACSRLAMLNNTIHVITSKTDDCEKKDSFSFDIIRLESLNILGGTLPIPLLSKKNRSIISKLITNEKPDIFVTNTRFFPLTFLAIILARKNHIPLLHIEHGTTYPKLSNLFFSSIAFLYDQIIGRLVFALSSKHFAISESAAQFSKRLGAHSPKIIYNSVDTTKMKPNRKENNKEIILIYVGRLIKAKGIQDLITAMSLIKNKEIKLLIIGTGNFESNLKKQSENDNRIIFLGQKNIEEIKVLLNSAEIFINPSYSEGLPTSVLEAGAMECAVIATDVGGTREIISNNRNGYLVPIKSPDILKARIESLIKNKQKRKLFSSNIRETVNNKFDWEKNICNFNKELAKHSKAI